MQLDTWILLFFLLLQWNVYLIVYSTLEYQRPFCRISLFNEYWMKEAAFALQKSIEQCKLLMRFGNTLESTVSWDVVLMLPTFRSSCSLSVTSSISLCILSVAFLNCSSLCSACVHTKKPFMHSFMCNYWAPCELFTCRRITHVLPNLNILRCERKRKLISDY